MLKFYAWEPAFEERVDHIRKQELTLIRNVSLSLCFNQAMLFCSANFVSHLVIFFNYPPYNIVVCSIALQLFFIDILKFHDDVIKWKHFPCYRPFVRGIHRSPVNSPHKGQWRAALKFSLICTWINGWVNSRGAGDLRCNRAHYDVIVMWQGVSFWCWSRTNHGEIGNLYGRSPGYQQPWY